MKVKELLALPSNELAMVLEGLVVEYEDLRGVAIADYNGVYKRKKRSTIGKKIAKIIREFAIRGYMVDIVGNNVKYVPNGNTKKQERLV